MKLTKEQVDALLAYIAAKIRAESQAAADSSDGGLIETIQERHAEDELRRVLQSEE